MNLTKRILAFLLVLCFVGFALVGCGGKKDEGKENNEESAGNNGNNKSTETETNVYGEPSFTTPNTYDELDFEGEELTVLVRDSKISYREWGKETTEDELDEAVLMRNSAVEETLNVIMVRELVPNDSYDVFSTNYNNLIIQDVTSDFHYYDVAANYAYCGAYPNVRDYAANLLDKETFPYFDFSLPCWNQAIVNNTTMNDRLHYVSGDVNLTLFDAAMVIWYNKTLYDEKRDPADPDNMQLYALEGGWTYEHLYRWASRLYEDSNGTAGRQNDDTYGYANPAFAVAPHDAYPYAFDLEFLTYNPDGTHDFNIIGNNKVEDAFTKVRNLIDANGNCSDPTVASFTAGNYVFYPSVIYPGEDANMMIREMEDTYGLLPMPKYDVEQEEYGTTTQDFYTLMTVIDHKESTIPTKGHAVSAFLQLMTEESYTSVRGYYFNRIIKPKYFGTDDSEGTVTNSIALFDIIVANIEFEYWSIYSAQLNDVAWLWRDAFRDGATSIESVYLSNESSFIDAIHGTDEWLGLRSAD